MTRRSPQPLALALVWIVAFAVFARTAYPTITWWDSSQYSLAAATLGVTGPPGSLLLTLLGWSVTRLPTGLAPAHALNLLAGALAATAVALVLLAALRLLRRPGGRAGAGADRLPGTALAGAAVGALAFAFSATLWQYAVQFTPYVLTGVVTALILWTLLRWWEGADGGGAWRWLLLLGLLFGLDYSVHRTNALLIPGAVAWILVRRPRTIRSARAWIGGVAGLLAGMTLQLLLIPIASAHPTLNMGDPSSWARFYDYESLAQLGGGWLVQFFPRHAALWSVQAMDLVRAFGANFLWVRGPWGVLGWAPALLGAVGWLALWRRERRLALAFAALLVLLATLTVAYFNIPANFFRPFDRHYLPVFTTWAVLVCLGAAATASALAEPDRPGRRRAVRWAAAALLLLVPLGQLRRNWRETDGATRWFTEDFAVDLLRGLPRNAILFTSGDNDTFPLWYEQAVGGIRPDVQVVNIPLTSAHWYLDEIARHDPTFPTPPAADSLDARTWKDTTVVIPVSGTPERFGLPEGLPLPSSIRVDVPPTTSGTYILRMDLVLLGILEENRWRRPFCVSTTVGRPALPGLVPYARLDGLFWRVVPRTDPPADLRELRANLLETHTYRGYADPGVPLEEPSRIIGLHYYAPFVALLQAEAAAGDGDGCRRSRETLLRALPPSRLRPDTSVVRAIDSACVRRVSGRD
jgi:hypothetical protein